MSTLLKKIQGLSSKIELSLYKEDISLLCTLFDNGGIAELFENQHFGLNMINKQNFPEEYHNPETEKIVLGSKGPTVTFNTEYFDDKDQSKESEKPEVRAKKPEVRANRTLDLDILAEAILFACKTHEDSYHKEASKYVISRRMAVQITAEWFELDPIIAEILEMLIVHDWNRAMRIANEACEL